MKINLKNPILFKIKQKSKELIQQIALIVKITLTPLINSNNILMKTTQNILKIISIRRIKYVN